MPTEEILPAGNLLFAAIHPATPAFRMTRWRGARCWPLHCDGAPLSVSAPPSPLSFQVRVTPLFSFARPPPPVILSCPRYGWGQTKNLLRFSPASVFRTRPRCHSDRGQVKRLVVNRLAPTGRISFGL